MSDPEETVASVARASGIDATTSEPKNPVDSVLAGSTGEAIATVGDTAGRKQFYDSEGNPISKNQFKKLRRKEAYDATRMERRQALRSRKKENRKRRHEELMADPHRLAEYRREQQDRQKRRSKVRDSGVTIILDCEFDELMTPNEIISLSGQIARCYADNRAAMRRVKLLVTGVTGKLGARYRDVLKDVQKSWKRITFYERAYLGAPTDDSSEPEVVAGLSKDRLVYLSADADEVLETLEPGYTYIVGGIVDHNRYKNLCLDKARAQGIRTAQLPIAKYMDMTSRRVLTVNQVHEICLHYLDGRDWAVAFDKAIPGRKMAKVKTNDATAPVEDEDEDEQDEDGLVKAAGKASSDDDDDDETENPGDGQVG
ncbi:tRNA (guanine(9)-N(1))-methyltransferase [Savitreella phatthalungensis]